MTEPNDVPTRWRPGAPRRSPEDRTRQARRRWTLALALVAAALVGAVVAFLSWLRPLPHADSRVLWVGSPPGLRAPAWAARDREALGRNPLFARAGVSAADALDHEGLNGELSGLAVRPRADVLVVFLSGYAESHGGEVRLLPTGAGAEPTPFRDVLRALASRPDRHKLLILDLTSPPSDPRRGLLGDDPAGVIPADLDAIPDPARLTLLSHAAGQTAAAMDDERRSAFGYYLDRGLRGFADGALDGARDGMVTARELATYVGSRVERWTSRNRPAQQTPALHGPAGDFALLSVGTDPAPEPAESPTAYPDWLRDGWKVRQRLWDLGDYRAGPASFHLTEAMLLDAERNWFEGVDAGHGADDLKADLARLDKRRVPPPGPDAPSLGAQTAQGRKPDAKAVEAVRAAIDPERLAPPAPPAPAVAVPAETLAALKDRAAFDVASAVWGAASEDADVRPGRLRSLDAVLRTVQPEPQFAETALLRRLAEMASRTGGAWPAETVRRALETARTSEQVTGDLDAPRVRNLLEAAAQHRYEGETLLLACGGYASTEEADRELQAAAQCYDACRHSLDAIRRGRQSLDRARAFLPAYVPYLEWEASPRKDWEQAAAAAWELAALLDAPEPTGADAVLRRNDELARSTGELESVLDRLSRPFEAGRLAELRTRLRKPQAQAPVLVEAEAVLATPLSPAEERGTLWEAVRALAHRLHEETARLDQADDVHHAAVAAQPTESPERASPVLRRARVSLALLHMGGLAPDELKPIREALARAEETAGDPVTYGPAVDALAAGLHQAWADADARLHDASQDAALRERLSWVWQPAVPVADAIDALPTPQTETRARRLQELAEQRADRARYESHDLAALGALPDWLARFYRDATRGLPARGPENRVELSADPPAVRLGRSDGAGTTTLEIRVPGLLSADAETTLRFLTPPGRWFDVAASAPGQPLADGSFRLPAASSVRVPLRIALHPGGRAAVPPDGILAEASVGGRVFHRLIPVSIHDFADRLEVFLSADPAGAEPLDELRLRPLKGRQSYLLFVRNLSARPRNLTVRLTDAAGPISGGEAKVSLRANETQPVHFAPPPAPKAEGAPVAPAPAPAAAPAEADLPEIKGPLEVRLLDADAGDAAAEVKSIPVAVASAAEYTQVADVRFTPGPAQDGGTGNRLAVTVRAAPGLTGPPCPVELVLPGPGGDGVRKAKKGTFQGEVTAGAELTLTAEEIPVGPGPEEEGLIYLTVDGRPRAYVFRTTFPRIGDPVTARPRKGPALRLRAPTAAPAGPRFEVGVEVDDAPPGSTLEVALGQFRDGRFETEEVRRFPSPQNSRVGFRPAGPDDALTFEAAVSDWTAVFDARRIIGRRELRARLLDRDGAEVRTAFQPVALDDAAPEGVSFVDAPKRARKDAPLPLTATARSTSGVARATFFLGRPTADHKTPPDAATFPAQPTDPDRTLWSAVLPLKVEKAGPIDVSVEMVNAAGLSAFATTTVELTDADPGANDPGRIEGSVYEGSVPQPNLDVVLRDDKGAEKGRVKTGADGKFAFDKVAPGPYALTTEKTATKRYGTANVTVAPGKTAPAVEIKLLMR